MEKMKEKQLFKRYKLIGKIYSPVHIGTGEEVDPLEYVINVKDKKFHKINLTNLITDFDETQRKTFDSYIEKSEHVQIRQFITDCVNIDIEKYSIYTTDVSEEVAKLYSKNLSSIENQLLIETMPHDYTLGRAYIPGSSIKGAIRTAILSEFGKNLPKIPEAKSRFAEKIILETENERNPISKDPFRAIKIKDAYLSADSTIIQQVCNGKRKEDRNGRQIFSTSGMQMIMETTHSDISNTSAHKKAIDFTTEILIDTNLQNLAHFEKSLSIEKIADSCRKFYEKKIINEYNKFYEGTPIDPIAAKLNTLINNKNPNQFIIRLGRFSHYESVTLDTHRNVKPKYIKGKPYGPCTARNIADAQYPMGWVEFTYEEIKD